MTPGVHNEYSMFGLLGFLAVGWLIVCVILIPFAALKEEWKQHKKWWHRK